MHTASGFSARKLYWCMGFLKTPHSFDIVYCGRAPPYDTIGNLERYRQMNDSSKRHLESKGDCRGVMTGFGGHWKLYVKSFFLGILIALAAFGIFIAMDHGLFMLSDDFNAVCTNVDCDCVGISARA